MTSLSQHSSDEDKKALQRKLAELELENEKLRRDLGMRISESETRETQLIAMASQDEFERRHVQLRTESLLALDEVLRNALDPAEIAFQAAEILGRALKVSRAGYGTVDLHKEIITVEKDWNAPGIKTIAGVLNFRDYGSYIDDLKRGETVIISDAYLDPRTKTTADALKGISAQAFINMPVTESEGLVALLYLNHENSRDWPPEDLSLVREFAQRTRMAVQRRQAENDLQQLAATLETKVVERTRELMEMEEVLRQSQKMEAVGQLTGGIAHDFNNLLAGITGSLELMKVRGAQGRYEDFDRYIGMAQSSAKRAAALTHRLLAFSRRQTLEPKLVNLNRLVAGMEELTARTMGPNITVNVVGSMSLWNTIADPSQLENSLLNLCINARDAMPDGGRLTIETANRSFDSSTGSVVNLPAGQYVSLCVTDTGVGMAPDVAAKAFDPFFTTKPLGQGTGLGLSMIYGFARQSKGHARIYSEPGHGTTVCIYLPRHVGDSSAEVYEGESPVQENAHGDGQTILLVDDEPALRAVIIEALSDQGYRVIEAIDGPSALVTLRGDSKIDMLITDVGLPGGMNGRQIADAARDIRADLPVVFITGYAENAALGEGQLEKRMSVLTKPFSIDLLLTRVSDLIDPKQR